MHRHLLAAAVATILGSGSILAHADDDTTIGGKAYVDVTNIDQTSNGEDTSNKGTGIDVKRFYLVIDHKFDDVWSADLTTDFNYVSNDSETQVFVKKAYVQAKLSDEFIARAGSADMPWIPFAENWYGYRYVENTLVDRLKFGNSADWGVHMLDGGKGIFNYAVSVVDGAGYKHPERSGSIDVEGRVGIQPVPGLMLAVGGYSGKRGMDLNNNDTPALHTATRGDALVAYQNNAFRIGAEYFTSNNWNRVTQVDKDKSNGWSVWGNVNFTPEVAIFARYDSAKPSKDLDPSLKDRYYNVGVEWALRKGIKVAAVYKHEKLDNNTDTNLKTNEIGVWSEIKF
ncbi:MAG: porin [Rhodanobacteraceae bacterium]